MAVRLLFLSCLLVVLPAAATPFTTVTGVQATAAGEFHSCLVLSDGTVECFGLNEHGQLGDASTKQRVTSGPVAGLDDATRVVAGAAHSCALREGGTVACWGRNDLGQVGNGGDASDVLVPTAVAGLAGVISLSAGAHHTCAVSDAGALWCWGANGAGQLGDGTTTMRNTPVSVTLTDVASVDAGSEHTCAVTAGVVYCWGGNAEGQLGSGDTTPSLLPAVVSGLEADVTRVAAGAAHTCALRADEVACWGGNADGEAGGEPSGRRLSPFVIEAPGVADITAGRSHTCALDAGGAVSCWGNTALFEHASITGVVQFDATHDHLCAARSNGEARCTGGSQHFGERGTGYARTRLDAVAVRDNTRDVVAGMAFACALSNEGLVRCWGGDDGAQIFGEDVFQVWEPALISELSGVTALTAADFHVCTLKGPVATCWGGLGYGEVGFDTWLPVPKPMFPVVGAGPLESISAGTGHTCSVTEAGAAVCWGQGPVGDGSVDNAYAPVPASGLSSGVKQVVAGAGHRCALLDDGTVQCWGRLNNANPNALVPIVGDGSGQPKLTPVAIDLQGVAALAAGRMHTCALLDTGRVRCWGFNAHGQLGDGTATDRFTPVEVPGLENVAAIHAGPGNTCAVLENDSAACWGRGLSGELGNGKRESSLVPVAVTTWDAPIAALGLGDGFTCAASTFGELRCWGLNTDGQLGEGGLQGAFSRPVQRSLAPYRLFDTGFEGD